MKWLSIMEAREGGFVVFDGADPHIFRECLFAGSLDECLAYIKDRLARSGKD